MSCRVTILPHKQNIDVPCNENLLKALRAAGFGPDAPCGGHGSCGKCTVLIDGQPVLACRTIVRQDLVVTLPSTAAVTVLAQGLEPEIRFRPVQDGYLLAIDIGTTTLAGCLLDKNSGDEIATASRYNPQTAYGADVVSRIQAALSGNMDAMTSSIRQALDEMTMELCQTAQIQPSEIGVVCLVGNPAMQQFFLGILPKNLAQLPYAPILTETAVVPASCYLPRWERAKLLIVPNVAGFIGADTLGCVLASDLHRQQAVTLMVDIGTNGEMVLKAGNRMAACSTAAGPALEGAKIRFGMRGAPGAIDHVWFEDGKLRFSVIGGGTPIGICGSGLIDAVSALLDAGFINSRGRIQKTDELDGERIIRLTDEIYLTQNDIREIQLAKGAIAAGIELLAAHLGIHAENIDRVLLAGAFGTFMDPDSACRIGLLPAALQGKCTAIGNAALSGAKLLARNKVALEQIQTLLRQIEFLELASLPLFPKTFARNMGF